MDQMLQDTEWLSGEIVVYDTEYTAWEGSQECGWSRPGELRELIQIAAIRVDVDRDFEEIDVLDLLVRPLRNPVLSEYVSDLTGIDQNQIITKGRHPANALHAFGAFCGSTKAWSYGRDDLVLAENRSLVAMAPSPHRGGFGDLRPGLAQAGISIEDRTSGTLHKAVGICMQGQPHNALFDVRSILACLKVLRSLDRL